MYVFVAPSRVETRAKWSKEAMMARAREGRQRALTLLAFLSRTLSLDGIISYDEEVMGAPKAAVA